VYAAREEPLEGVDSRLVVDGAVRAGARCSVLEPGAVRAFVDACDCGTVAFMGAGMSDVYAHDFLGEQR
jgi:hypothetical protein